MVKWNTTVDEQSPLDEIVRTKTSKRRKLVGGNGPGTKSSIQASVLGALMLIPSAAMASPFSFSTGNPDGLVATASRPESNGKIEIESADDFILSNPTTINHATFTGLLPSGATVDDVRVEIYRVFPKDSQFPPSGRVPTRDNSPSDVEFDDRDLASGNLTFSTSTLSASFTAANSVLNGIHPKPDQTTLGEGPVTGEEVQFDVDFTTPFNLPADHYFFVPQVQLANGDFFWLSAPKPIVAPGTPFVGDLQSWVRNGDLDPDWLRIGTDIIGGSQVHPLNATFSLSGSVPDSSPTVLLFGFGLLGLVGFQRQMGVRRNANS